jgi:DNA-binding CsgD family transcriptional regulator
VREEVAAKSLAARLALARGQPDEATALARQALVLADRFGTRLLVSLAACVLTTMSIRHGSVSKAAAWQGRFRDDQIVLAGPLGWATAVWARARVVESRHGAAAALDLLTRARGSRPGAFYQLLLDEPSSASYWVRLALASGDQRGAAQVGAGIEVLRSHSPELDGLAASASHTVGLLEQDPDAISSAAAMYRDPWARAVAEEDLAVLLWSRDRPTARLHHDRAVAAYRASGSIRDVERLRRRHALRADRPLSGWASLSDSERRVAELVALGMRNHEVAQAVYLSRHTVDFHLRQVFRKLQINSRVELARVAVACGAVADPTMARAQQPGARLDTGSKRRRAQ